MTELKLHKFINDNYIEYRWDLNNKKDDVIVWIPFYLCDEFSELIEPDNFSDGGGMDVRFQKNCVAFFISEICDYWGVEIENVFPKD